MKKYLIITLKSGMLTGRSNNKWTFILKISTFPTKSTQKSSNKCRKVLEFIYQINNEWWSRCFPSYYYNKCYILIVERRKKSTFSLIINLVREFYYFSILFVRLWSIFSGKSGNSNYKKVHLLLLLLVKLSLCIVKKSLFSYFLFTWDVIVFWYNDLWMFSRVIQHHKSSLW